MLIFVICLNISVHVIIMAATSNVLIFSYSFVHRSNDSFHCVNIHSLKHYIIVCILLGERTVPKL